MVLFEHRWAIPLKEAVVDAGGVVVAQGMVQPETLIGIGMRERLAADDMAATQTDTSQSSQQMH